MPIDEFYGNGNVQIHTIKHTYMEVTKKYLDQRFAGIKKDIKESEKRVKKYSDDNTDKLGRVINSALQELEGRLDVRFKELREMDVRSQMLTLQRRVEKIEAQMFGKTY
jgi:hypothetical protein